MAKFEESDPRWLVKDLGDQGTNVNNWHCEFDHPDAFNRTEWVWATQPAWHSDRVI